MNAANKKYIFISVLCAAGAALLALLTARAFFRPLKYYVRVEDSLYSEYIENKDFSQDKLPFKVIAESDSLKKSNFFAGEISVTAGYVHRDKDFNFTSGRDGIDTRRYLIDAKNVVPEIKADFTSGSKNQNAPDLEVELCYEDGLSEGYRAVPVDGKYAGDENYLLEEKEYAVCTCFVNDVSQQFYDWCEKTFAREEKSLKASDSTIFVESVGDIMVARGAQEIILSSEDDTGLEKVFNDTLPLLRKGDITIGNLEGVVTDSWSNATKTYTFKFNKKVLPYLKRAGFTYLMQTNNHCYDYGEAGFKDTLAAFKEYDIPTSGVGANLKEASKFYHTNVKGQNFAIISCGAFPVERSGFDGKKTATATDKRAGILWQSDEILEAVKKEKAAGNFVIVNVHGGEEYHFTPSASQKQFYQSLCDSGADVVFGSHPHVLQDTQWYNGSLIVYSQGNFIFNGMEGMKGGTDSEIVRLGIRNGKILYVEQYKARLKGCTVSLAE